MTIQDFIKKLQALSEKQKIAIIAVVVVIAALIMGYFWVTSAMQSISQIGSAVKSAPLPTIDLNSIAGTTSPSDQPATADDSQSLIETASPSN